MPSASSIRSRTAKRTREVSDLLSHSGAMRSIVLSSRSEKRGLSYMVLPTVVSSLQSASVFSSSACSGSVMSVSKQDWMTSLKRSRPQLKSSPMNCTLPKVRRRIVLIWNSISISCADSFTNSGPSSNFFSSSFTASRCFSSSTVLPSLSSSYG